MKICNYVMSAKNETSDARTNASDEQAPANSLIQEALRTAAYLSARAQAGFKSAGSRATCLKFERMFEAGDVDARTLVSTWKPAGTGLLHP